MWVLARIPQTPDATSSTWRELQFHLASSVPMVESDVSARSDPDNPDAVLVVAAADAVV